MAILVDEKEDVSAFANYKTDDSTPAPTAPAPDKKEPEQKVEAAPVKKETAVSSSPSSGRIFASPLA